MCTAPLEGYAGAYIGTTCVCVHDYSSSDELCPRLVNVAKIVARKRKSVHFCHLRYFVYNIVPMVRFASIFGDNFTVEILRDDIEMLPFLYTLIGL